MKHADTKTPITSRQNEQVKRLRRALERGERTADGLLAIDTFHLVEEALSSGLELAQVYFTPRTEAPLDQLLAKHRSSPRRICLAASVFEAVSPAPAAQGVAALVRLPEWSMEAVFRPAPALVVVLAGVQDPGNAGTILRTAEAFGATGALFLEGSVHPENAKLIRASAGSAFRLPRRHGLKYGEALEALRRAGAHLYAAAPRAPRTLEQVDLRGPVALAIGAEGPGMPGPILAAAEGVAIPQARPVESLNAAVAAGIFLYAAARARGGR